MTSAKTTTDPQPGTSAAESPFVRPRFRGRRFWVSILVAVILIVVTLVASAIEAPDPSDERFLSPQSDHDMAASTLSEELSAAGVQIDRYVDATAGLEAAAAGDVTLFIPAPDYLNAEQQFRLDNLRLAGERMSIVSIEPGQRFLNPIRLRPDGGARIATATLEPECELAAAAGPAQLGRQSYVEVPYDDGPAGVWRFCYAGHLAWYRLGDTTETVVGAADPFTNQWIGEAGNRQLATGLLDDHDRVIWLDVHSVASVPPPTYSPNSPPPSASDDHEPSRVPINYPEAGQTSPLYDALPSWLWAGLVGILLLLIMAALWRGRRLGPPTTEPLPVTVPAAETVYGRARLYRRAGAFPQALRALRAGALHRVRPVIGLSSQAGEAEVVTAITERTGWSREQVTEVLFHSQPRDERELLQISHALDQLVSAVENSRPQGRDE